ncbi:hypothetical protein AKJ38_02505 [candidate division MSBL1 archaeon SCGC-AAA259I14]|uniref:Uncharacterized protein n=1 Tax=candidate division MSBL1 archaeon SCGC-AAA259I14 TaxID=1698268 RepID=A0A133URF7_9EURY|nr:hypothetical protein AKJ38_02505 [candidate division MSBL1 archaeon SCGC-AAA259I14]
MRIPIYFRHTAKEERGPYEVKGDLEQKVGAEVLNTESKEYYYRPEVREIRGKLRTTTVYMFSLYKYRVEETPASTGFPGFEPPLFLLQ